jgi:dTDP-4-dehydrorhamnose 3,5-epimerase
MIEVTPTHIPDVLVITPNQITDDRGAFYESFNLQEFQEKTGVNPTFVQNNQSINSQQGVLRGLHYQYHQPQAKLVRCTQGSIFDVAVDLRKDSATFGQWVGVELSEENRQQLWIPIGFAHGYLTLTERAVCQYQATDYWAKGDEYCLIWDDKTVNIQWPTVAKFTLSDKDKQCKNFAEIPYF